MTSLCIRALSRHTHESLRLIGFPHAGAGASAFHAWTHFLPPSIGLYAVQLAGREQRSDEQFPADWVHVISEIRDALIDWGDVPFVMYGHSLGGLIAYEVARALQEQGASGPRMLFAAGSYAPSAVCKAHSQFSSDEGLLRVVRRFGGLDEQLAANEEFIRYFLPVIAADFALFNKYQHTSAHISLACPVVALFGTYDEALGRKNAVQWGAHTSSSFHVREIRGGHFFHREHARETVASVIQALGIAA